MVWRAVVVAAVLGLLSCGPKIRRCSEGCPQDSVCDVPTGFCVRSLADAGGSDASTDFDAGCDVFNNVGCAANERCGVVLSAALTCVSPGSKSVGDPCAFSTSAGRASDDCNATLVCASGNGCRPACDGLHACPVGFECIFHDFGLARAIGACVPKCDPVSQLQIADSTTCKAGLACVGYPETGGRCVAERDPANVHGASAPAYLNGCAAGTMAMAFDGGSICTALCRPAEVHSGQTANAGGVAPYTCASRGAPNATCRFWNAYRPELVGTPGLNEWGYCSDPAFEQLPPCTALDAGEHLNYGCGPR